MRKLLLIASSIGALALAGCTPSTTTPADVDDSKSTTQVQTPVTTNDASGEPTIQEAKEFLEAAEKEIVELNEYGSRLSLIHI